VAAVERFVPAGELTLDDSLVDSQGRPIAIDAIRVTDRLITVYNLRVADFHTYFVGGKLWQFDAWVHNAGQIKYDGVVNAPSKTAHSPSSYPNPDPPMSAPAVRYEP
ncbi:MAG: polymorphic toxin-type HINT domain-containing protein, partial [Pirellulaceae bacterium]